jgi:two-component system NtrC family sensor kinase
MLRPNTDMGRLRLPRVERLTVRLVGGLTLLIVFPLAAGLYLLSNFQYDHAVAARLGAAELETRLLETALRHDMLTRDARLMSAILEEIGQQPEVKRAMVIDHNGLVKLSSRAAEVGIQTSQASPTCLVCHAETPAARQRWVIFREGGTDVLRSVLPVENRPECRRCHGETAKLNGMLVLDVSLAPVQAQFRRSVAWIGGATAAVTFLMLGGVGWHVRRLVLSRLLKLGHTARAIADGALDERADTAGNDVIASLAFDFNAMADATSRLIAEVKQREQQMSGVLNSLDDGLIVLSRDFRIVAANRSISKWLGAYPETLRGQTCRHVAGRHLRCPDDLACPTARCFATGRLEQATFRLPATGDGNERVYEIYASPVYTDDGSVGQVVEAWRDITDRVQEEQHLAEIERLSSLGVLASGLSHEVNTPLATTLTCAEAIIDQLQDLLVAPVDRPTLEAIRDSACTIRDQVLRCRTITDQFLRFARGIPPATEPIDLRDVVESVMSLARPTARAAGVELALEGGASVPVVTANTEVVQHVVLNLLVNAIESCADTGGQVVARFLVDTDVRLQIRDNGCGIAPEVQRRLFEPFRTAKPRGTGLGLFLSRTFMRRFHGDVRLVDSVVGRGSSIEVVFPLSFPEAP